MTGSKISRCSLENGEETCELIILNSCSVRHFQDRMGFLIFSSKLNCFFFHTEMNIFSEKATNVSGKIRVSFFSRRKFIFSFFADCTFHDEIGQSTLLVKTSLIMKLSSKDKMFRGKGRYGL